MFDTQPDADDPFWVTSTPERARAYSQVFDDPSFNAGSQAPAANLPHTPKAFVQHVLTCLHNMPPEGVTLLKSHLRSAKDGKRMTVSTLCSGTDGIIPLLEASLPNSENMNLLKVSAEKERCPRPCQNNV